MEENIVKSLTLPTSGGGGSSSPEFMFVYDNSYTPSFRPPTGTIEPGNIIFQDFNGFSTISQDTIDNFGYSTAELFRIDVSASTNANSPYYQAIAARATNCTSRTTSLDGTYYKEVKYNIEVVATKHLEVSSVDYNIDLRCIVRLMLHNAASKRF